jgi:hypothetical protein
MEGSAHGPIKFTIPHFLKGTGEVHGNPKSGYSVSLSRLEPGTLETKSKRIND